MQNFIDQKYLSDNSKSKYNIVLPQLLKNTQDNTDINPILIDLLYQMRKAFSVEPNIEIIHKSSINLNDLRKIFIDFDQDINQVASSKLQNDVATMNKLYSFDVIVENNHHIRLNILANDNVNLNLIAILIHSLNTFCYTFSHNYDGLTINVCLDDNRRDMGDISLSNGLIDVSDFFERYKTKSTAFNVSGVTYKQNKMIILTKKEEIVKLLYHELIHFIGLDEKLRGVANESFLAIDTEINLSETYAELMSVILYTAYQTIHYSQIEPINIGNFFARMILLETEYSIYLSSLVLKFYGYDKETYVDFFDDNNVHCTNCPIPIWEYVLFRAQLMENLTKNISNTQQWKISSKNRAKIVDLTNINEDFIDKIGQYMKNNDTNRNISYLMTEFDWSKF